MSSGQSNEQVAGGGAATTMVLDVAVLLDGSAFGSVGGGVLLLSCGSGVSLDMLPVFEIVVPAEVPEFTFITSVSFALAPGASVATVQVVVPPELLAAGKLQVQFVLSIVLSIWPDRKVVLAGVASVTTALAAASGPLFESHRTYKILDPAVIVPSLSLPL